jgi:hypothetical protein
MGGGLEADLSQGVVPALWMWSAPLAGWVGWCPVLQVVDVGLPQSPPPSRRASPEPILIPLELGKKRGREKTWCRTMIQRDLLLRRRQ